MQQFYPITQKYDSPAAAAVVVVVVVGAAATIPFFTPVRMCTSLLMKVSLSLSLVASDLVAVGDRFRLSFDADTPQM